MRVQFTEDKDGNAYQYVAKDQISEIAHYVKVNHLIMDAQSLIVFFKDIIELYSANRIILANGENVSPEEIENQISTNDLVKEIIVRETDKVIQAEIFPDYEYVKIKR